LKDLRKEYRATRRITKVVLNELKQKREAVFTRNGTLDNSSRLTWNERESIKRIDDDIDTVRKWLSNVNYGLQYMSLGHAPGLVRGIERRAAYEREVPFEPYWIQRRQATCDASVYEVESYEDANLMRVSQEEKEKIVQAMTQSLTDRQKDILQLASNGYTHEEIALTLGVHKGTIDRTMSRIKEKIADEGWFIP